MKILLQKNFSGVPSVAKVTDLLFLLRSFETLSARNREQEKDIKLVRDLFFMCRQIIAILNMEGDKLSYIILPSCLGLRVDKYQVLFQTHNVLLSASEHFEISLTLCKNAVGTLQIAAARAELTIGKIR